MSRPRPSYASNISQRLRQRLQAWLRSRRDSHKPTDHALPPLQIPRLKQIRHDRRGPWTRSRDLTPPTRQA
jgi:hypothetical protein